MTQNSTNYNVTQYNVIVGGASGTLVGIAPTSTSIPQYLKSNGTSANPSYASPSAYSFTMARQVFTTSGTYTPTTNMKYCIIECIGGGGGSGNLTGTQTTTVICNGGGGSGSYTRGVYSSATVGASQTVTIGSGGGSGAAGGTTSVGTLNTAPGGLAKGGISTATADIYLVIGGNNGGAGTGGSLLWAGVSGKPGFAAYSGVTAQFASGGRGGSSFFGGGARGNGAAATTSKGNGNNATSYGGGGGSAYMCSVTTPNATAGSGFAGIAIVTEFIYP